MTLLDKLPQKSLIERDRASIWHPFTQSGMEQNPLVVTNALGAKLRLDTGEELVDGISSWWCNLHGHGHPELIAAASNQFRTLDHVLFAGCTHEPAIALAEDLLAALPGDLSKVFYSDNGSTAVEIAIKLAIQWWHNHGEHRTTIIALNDSYHGDTFGAMSAGARGIFSKPFDDLLFKVARVSTRGSDEDLKHLEDLCASNTTAAFIFEPHAQGAGGMKFYSNDTLNRYLQIAQKYRVLTIADEVMTGFGRTGPLFASSRLALPPDMICLSKGLTNGSIPLAVTACTEQIYSGFISNDHSRTFFHGHTYTGNPIACAIARKSLELTLSPECSDARERIEAAHKRCLRDLAKIPTVSDPRVAGTIIAFDLNLQDALGYTSSIRDRAVNFFRSRGILLRPLGNIIYCMPPYCVSDQELDLIHTALIEFTHSVK